MKWTRLNLARWDEETVVACFGNARLVKRADGRLELKGGTDEDRQVAREWISLFLHEAIVAR